MLKTGALLLFGVAASNIAYADRHVHFTGDFESGAIQPSGSTPDGFYVKTLPELQGNVNEFTVAKGGAGPDSNLDTRVVPYEIPSGLSPAHRLVSPRKGNFFVRSAIHFNKDYSGFTGNAGFNNPRMLLNPFHSNLQFDFDVEGYTGFSIYLPENLEHETGVRGHKGENMLVNVVAQGGAVFYRLAYWVPTSAEGGGNVGHWWLTLSISDTSTDGKSAAKQNIDLGSVVPDLGKWTDFVVRWRSNPFASGQGYSCPVNPAVDLGISGAANQDFACNAGILQLWKATGAVDGNGNRTMQLLVDRVGQPAGQVPYATRQLGHSFRQYKYGWHNNPTDVSGPVWIGFDEIRYGLAARDGTDYQDVHPSLLACTDGCPGNASAPPPSDPPPAPPGDSPPLPGPPQITPPATSPEPPDGLVIVP